MEVAAIKFRSMATESDRRMLSLLWINFDVDKITLIWVTASYDFLKN